jgi:hypothetical protein
VQKASLIERKGYVHDYSINFLRNDDNGSGQKPRNKRLGIPSVSKKRAKENAIYEKEKTKWRKEREALDGFRCEFIEADRTRCPRRADRNPHHKKFRGKNLCDRRWFMAVCLTPHHVWITNNGKEAEKRGYIIRE